MTGNMRDESKFLSGLQVKSFPWTRLRVRPILWFMEMGPERQLIYNLNGMDSINFSCMSYGFLPSNITLKWFKHGEELLHFQPQELQVENSKAKSWPSPCNTGTQEAPGTTTMSILAPQHHLPLSSLLLPLRLGLTGVTGEQEELQVIQPEMVSATAGETAILPCTVTSLQPLGPINWFRGTGPDRQLIYNFKGTHDHLPLYPRVRNGTDITQRNNMDFSISISKITLADTNTYYCVKFKKGTPDTEFKSGAGTRVTVSGE
ncbi:PREDICTED: signal-regulatory protein beta-1 isoform 3-like [Chrysochloris asiatica]|uniref:Signal-regulatory protein beta-1 isoform 3-like n=1 Tax=Chrysochloris asiatica TaxID=185453 RepID=A0A9B0U7G3_CHRAS|nr:PREDICTED: signal-regulatory protein beta-1 isoform 3-like [Chrysochloris asiatica]